MNFADTSLSPPVLSFHRTAIPFFLLSPTLGQRKKAHWARPFAPHQLCRTFIFQKISNICNLTENDISQSPKYTPSSATSNSQLCLSYLYSYLLPCPWII
jgi:hypothetical protein